MYHIICIKKILTLSNIARDVYIVLPTLNHEILCPGDNWLNLLVLGVLILLSFISRGAFHPLFIPSTRSSTTFHLRCFSTKPDHNSGLVSAIHEDLKIVRRIPAYVSQAFGQYETSFGKRTTLMVLNQSVPICMSLVCVTVSGFRPTDVWSGIRSVGSVS